MCGFLQRLTDCVRASRYTTTVSCASALTRGAVKRATSVRDGLAAKYENHAGNMTT